MTDSISVSRRFETPLYDSLKPMHKKVVETYCELFDKRQAALIAGYTDNMHLDAKIREIFLDPKIIAAIDEFLASKLEQLDAGRAALCQRLFNLSMADIWDVAERIHVKNASGEDIPGKFTMSPLPLDKVEPRFKAAIVLLIRLEGTYGWDNMAQHRASTQLSKLMMWDQSILDVDPPMIFNFGDVQIKEYEPPSSEVDLSDVEKASDEIENLTH